MWCFFSATENFSNQTKFQTFLKFRQKSRWGLPWCQHFQEVFGVSKEWGHHLIIFDGRKNSCWERGLFCVGIFGCNSLFLVVLHHPKNPCKLPGQLGFKAGVYGCLQFGCDRFFPQDFKWRTWEMQLLCMVGGHWHETVRLTRYQDIWSKNVVFLGLFVLFFFFLKSFDFGVCSSSCKPKELSIFPFCVQRAQPYAVARVFEGKVLGHEVSTWPLLE